MELYAYILIPALACLAVAAAYHFGKIAGETASIKSLKAEYHDGWLAAKRYYHDEPREDQEQERKAVEKINEQNNEYMKQQLINDLCIAYGVAHPSSLPKNVREANNIGVNEDSSHFYSDSEYPIGD